jgi:sulfite reductase (NADPH) hemoprotein beta-component
MQLVTGNRLRDGVPIYFVGNGQWSPSIDAAQLVEDAQADALLAVSQEGAPPLPAVGSVLIEAVRENGHIKPISLRERIRAEGPTTGPMTHQTAIETAAR